MSTLAALGASARLSRLVLHRLGVPQLSAGLMTCSDGVCGSPSSSGNAGVPPSMPCAMAPGLSGFAVPWGGDAANSLLPQLCATPKKKVRDAYIEGCTRTLTATGNLAASTWPGYNTPKPPHWLQLSPHRRGNRRVWYWLKRKPEFAKCRWVLPITIAIAITLGPSGADARKHVSTWGHAMPAWCRPWLHRCAHLNAASHSATQP